MESKIYNKKYYLVLFSCALILGMSTLILTTIHPVSWPSTASLPGVVNMIDTSKLSEDFFAKSSQGSPTIIFQKLLFYVSYVTEHDPIKSMVILGSIVSFFYFPLFFLITQKGLENLVLQLRFDKQSKKLMPIISLGLTFCIFIFFIIFQDAVNNRFTNMMWPPILLNPNAYIVSMLLGIGGALLSVRNRYICVLLLSISCLIHPTMGFFTAVFCFLLLSDFSSKLITLKNIALFFIPILLVYIFLLIYYPQSTMSVHDFIEIYIYQRHPHHYLISTSFQKKQWLIVLVTLLAETGILILARNKMWINSLLALVLLALVPPIHYFFTEIYQIKIIAIFGFTRFFTFAVFLIIFFGLAAFLSLLALLNQYWKGLNRAIVICERIVFPYQNICIGSIILLMAASALLANYVHRELIFTDNSINAFNNKYQNILYEIPDSSVVMMLDEDDFHFGLFGKKNLYSTEAFPFSELQFFEYADRRRIFQNCEKNLSINSLVDAKNQYKLDYLLMKRERLSKLPGAIPVAENDNLVLINVKEYLKNKSYL